VAFIHAHFGVAIFFARRAPTARPCVAASDKAKIYSNKKGFTFGNNLHFTKPSTLACFSRVICRPILVEETIICHASIVKTDGIKLLMSGRRQGGA